jgi:hypothetical protein
MKEIFVNSLNVGLGSSFFFFFYVFLVNLKGFDNTILTASAIFAYLVFLDTHGKYSGKVGC